MSSDGTDHPTVSLSTVTRGQSVSSPQPSKHRKSESPSMTTSRIDDMQTVQTHDCPTTIIVNKPECCDVRQEPVDRTNVAATHYSNDKHDPVRPQVISPSQQCKDQMSYSEQSSGEEADVSGGSDSDNSDKTFEEQQGHHASRNVTPSTNQTPGSTHNFMRNLSGNNRQSYHENENPVARHETSAQEADDYAHSCLLYTSPSPRDA